MTTTPSLGRSSIVMASGTLVSRALGLVRNLVLIAAVGVNIGAANAFDVANKIPNVMFAILASGMLNAVLVPQIVRAYKRKQGEEFTNRILTVAGTIMLAVTLVLTLGSAWVIGLYIDNWSPELTALAVAFGFWCIPQLFFYGLYTLLGQVLNARSIFGPFMWAPVANNVISIAGFSAFIAIFGRYDAETAHDISSWTGAKIALLGGSATLGIAAQALVLIWPLWRSGFRFRFRWKLRGMGMRSMGKVAAWTTLATLLEQVGVLVITRVTSAAGEHSGELLNVAGNAAYTQALMIYLLPHSLITVSITTALFTQLSAAAAAGDIPRVRADLSLGMRTVGVFTIFATAALIVLAVPITRVILFTAAHPGEITSVARVLSVMALGLVPLGGMLLMKRAYFAFEDGFTIFLIQIPVTAITITGSLAGMYLLTPDWWAAGAGASMALGSVVAGAGRLRGLHRRLKGLDGARILRLYVRLIIGALGASAVGYAVVKLLGTGADDPVRALIVVVVGGLTMLGTYLIALHLMRVRELATLLSPVTRKLWRR
ncbi:MAG TPA: murein biosynthesis integral membrane protein MurJ [Actinomycetales bacterium]|nr:murein biosynthesis integral membrane protein MurJ [Actinomycetales bacterium]